MTAKQAKKLKKGDKVVYKKYAKQGTQTETTVDYVAFNPLYREYFIATTDGLGGYHKHMDLAT